MSVRIETNAEPIPGYRLIERIGGGGFGEVWRAEAPGGMHKAIKFVFGDLSCANDDGVRAEQELKALKRVQSVRHPYILTLERYDIVDGQLMIVMELADRNLWDRFKECRTQSLPGIPREELLRYMEETAEALDLMNCEHQLQHLDIKPQNIFLVHQHIKVADFGLVKDLEGSQANVTGGITPVYAAPETFDGKVTRFSDQYSLAIVFQELLTGQRPFAGNNVRQLILQHIQGTPNVSPLPPGDRPHIARALGKVPNERFPTCRALVQSLRATVLTGVAVAPLPGSAPGTIPFSMPGQAQPTGNSLLDQAPPSSGPLTANIRVPIPDTGSGHGTTQPLRALEPSVLKGPEAVAFRAPAEIKGPGTLFPAVVIGLGQMGLTVMQRLRENLHTHVSPLGQLPHLRFFLVDTDPDVVRMATHGRPGCSLTAGDVLLTQLNRPSYYLKSRDGRPTLSAWLNPRMLYRIPRSQVTTGVRALGRLAFTDNYRAVLRRLQLELEAALEPQSLTNAARQTGLGVRSNRPRVYLITSLAGGTGSGMFLDMAYTVRALLRQMGYENPDVVGLLLLPPVDAGRTRVMPLGNTYAALTEMNYYGTPGTTFQAKYHEREAAIKDPDPPFTRTILLPLPDESDEVATQEVVELCSQMLCRDLTSPLGKAADLSRAGLTAPPWETRGQYYQTFGLFQLSWPRHSMLQAVARRLCQRIVQRWISKDSKPLREGVQTWVQEQWALFELGPDHFIHRLQAEVVKALGKPPDLLFDEAIKSLIRNSAQGEAPGEGAAGGRSGKGQAAGRLAKSLDPEALAGVLAQMEELVGKPQDDPTSEGPRLMGLLRQGADQLGNAWSQKLAELAVHLIEEPAFRLAGAEEAIRQIVATVEQVLQHHEPLARDMAGKAAEAHERLVASSVPIKQGQRRPAPAADDIIELLRSYTKKRYQSLVLHHLTAAFVSLRGHLSDEQREVNFCRVRLTDLLHKLEETPVEEQRLLTPADASSTQGSIGRRLFLSGCKDLRGAVDLYLEGITTEHLLELDGRMEEMLKGSFTALVHVCLTSANILKNLEAAMLQTARDYAAEHLPPTSVSQLFLEQNEDDETAEREIAEFYDEAAPELSAGRNARGGPPVQELCIVAAPEDDASACIHKLVEKTLPETEVHKAGSADDILIYRERNNLALADLEHLGAVGHDAYVQMSTAENFTPHSRTDINFRSRPK